MKLTSMFLALAGALILTGCDSPALLSLDPVVTDQEAVFDPTLLGTWGTNQDKDKDLCIFRRDGASGYAITYVSDGSARQFTARLFRAGEASMLDLTPESSDDFQIAGHAVVRIWTEGGALRWTYLDTEWLRKQASQLLPNRAGDKRMVLTAPGAAVRAFVAKYGVDDKAHGDTAEWQRVQF
jgi:hypothetical protein